GPAGGGDPVGFDPEEELAPPPQPQARATATVTTTRTSRAAILDPGTGRRERKLGKGIQLLRNDTIRRALLKHLMPALPEAGHPPRRWVAAWGVSGTRWSRRAMWTNITRPPECGCPN